MKKRLPYIQLELFEDVTPETCEPNTQENKENIFELLYKAIKCATKKSAYRTPIEQRTVDIAQQKYLKGIKETDIAQSLELSTERIRQLRVKFIESFMHPEGKNRRFFIYAKYFQESAPNFIGQDPAQVVATSDGTPLPYSLLDFIDMTYFEEYEYARQAFIAPKEQADSLRIHNHFLVLELRNHVTPIALETLMPKLEETITDYGTAFSRESITQLIKGNHQINEDNGQIIIDYAALNLPSQKIKRIIYEHKKIHKKDILRIYNEREIANGQTEDKLPQELNMVLVKKTINALNV